MKWTKQMVDRAAELKEQGLSNREAAEKLSEEYHIAISKTALRLKLARSGHRFTSTHQPLRNVAINSDGSQTATVLMRLRHEPNKSPETLMKLAGYDPSLFDMISGDYKVYEQHSTKDGTVPQYSVHVRVKPKAGTLTSKDLIALLNSNIKPVNIPNERIGQRNLVVPLFDLHFGISTYDHLRPVLNQIVAILHHGYKHIVIELGGDLLHSDFMNTTQTVKGTQLDHVNTVKAWSDAKLFVGQVIETAIANSMHVSLRAIGGNHDHDMQWAFVDGLADRYPQVHVHNTIEYRQAFRLEHVGILMAHGDVALKRLPMLFANEYPDIWATSTWREIQYGHFHHEVVDDELGVIMRQLGTPKPLDNYERKNGLTMAQKTLQVFEYDDSRLRVTYDVG
ncbi:transposase [Lactobacillus rhamnosus]|uniref:Transposase n=1 Tax=Lacticaseibacillus rhamnosus TaxID=47715 RepID=A0A7Y7QHQ5_LACRH|nr:transposase [Lacticaseibacillus rhamnosus]NVO88935.1 transposase [Lacticaseibacillus rhamnosus]